MATLRTIIIRNLEFGFMNFYPNPDELRFFTLVACVLLPPKFPTSIAIAR